MQNDENAEPRIKGMVDLEQVKRALDEVRHFTDSMKELLTDMLPPPWKERGDVTRDEPLPREGPNSLPPYGVLFLEHDYNRAVSPYGISHETRWTDAGDAFWLLNVEGKQWDRVEAQFGPSPMPLRPFQPGIPFHDHLWRTHFHFDRQRYKAGTWQNGFAIALALRESTREMLSEMSALCAPVASALNWMVTLKPWTWTDGSNEEHTTNEWQVSTVRDWREEFEVAAEDLPNYFVISVPDDDEILYDAVARDQNAKRSAGLAILRDWAPIADLFGERESLVRVWLEGTQTARRGV